MTKPSFVNEPSELVKKIDHVCEQIRGGGMVIMVDDQSRENEGDLVMAAEDVSPKAINFMAKEGRGLICLPMEPSMIDRLQLPMMSDHSKNMESRKTAFTVSIEAKCGVSTGISAEDRATTIKVAIDSNSQPHDLVVPGHVFPLKACEGGVLTRAGHTEGSVDLMKLASKKPASVICEIMNDDGTMARRDDLEIFSQRNNIPIISIEEIITYRMLFDSYVVLKKRETIQTSYGEFDAVWFESEVDHSCHVALVKGDGFENHVTDVRVYRQNFLNDIFGAPEPDLSIRRVEYGLDMLSKCQRGVYLYLSSPPLESALPPKESVKNTQMDAKLYGTGAQILRKLGVRKLTLNTLTPRNLVAIGGFGLEVVGVRVLKEQPSKPSSSTSKSPRPLPQKTKRILFIRSLWHPEIVDGLVTGAKDFMMASGIMAEQITERSVPGSYELLWGAQQGCQESGWELIFCFGCLIKGQTWHDQWVREALKHGFVHLQLTHNIPIIPCVLSTDSRQQALERSQKGSRIHRGREAAEAGLKLLPVKTKALP